MEQNVATNASRYRVQTHAWLSVRGSRLKEEVTSQTEPGHRYLTFCNNNCFLQEKVEEDRFMKAQEKEFIEKKRKKMAEKMHVEEEAIFKEKVAPAMAEAQNVLKKAGGASVSHDALEALAKWKLNM